MSAAPQVGILAEIERHRIALRESREAEIREATSRQRLQIQRLAATGAFSASDPLLRNAGLTSSASPDARAIADNALALAFQGKPDEARATCTTRQQKYAVYAVSEARGRELFPEEADNWTNTKRITGG